MNPLSAIILLILCGVIFAVSRRLAFLALMAGVLYVPQNQALNLGGFNLFPSRLLELSLFIRLVGRREWSFSKLNGIDRAFLALYSFTTVVFLLRSAVGQSFQIGEAVDAFLIYFTCRNSLDGVEDFRWLFRAFVLLLVPYAALTVIEHVTARSPLAFMGWGGAVQMGDIWMRGNAVRCFGSFRHPSLLGTLGVAFIPIFIGMAFNPMDRKRAALGIVLCLVIVWTTNSGGPLSGVAFGCVAWCCWALRKKMRLMRWGILSFFCLAAVLMKAPVWYLLAHVSAITGGDGWHRAYLMEVSYNNVGKWWLIGMPLSGTHDWFPYALAANDGADITNLFILFGITAGIGAIALFVLLLRRAFGALGNALLAVRIASPERSDAEFLLWGLGCMLAAHIINWLGVTYFDQTNVFWFIQLAAISKISDEYLQASARDDLNCDEEENSLVENNFGFQAH